MSHIETVKGEYKDLSILEATLLSYSHPIYGKIIKKNKKTYKWYGKHVGDYPLPPGIKKEDLGKCDYCYGFEDESLYEIGVIERNNTYIPLYDFWSLDNSPNTQGGPLQTVLGDKGSHLIQDYTVNVIKSVCTEEGYVILSQSMDREGNITLEVEV